MCYLLCVRVLGGGVGWILWGVGVGWVGGRADVFGGWDQMDGDGVFGVGKGVVVNGWGGLQVRAVGRRGGGGIG